MRLDAEQRTRYQRTDWPSSCSRAVDRLLFDAVLRRATASEMRADRATSMLN
jgi:hypothetical protein